MAGRHFDIDTREPTDEPQPFLRLCNIGKQQRIVGRAAPANHIDQDGGILHSAHVQIEPLAYRKPELPGRAGRHDDGTRLGEPLLQRLDPGSPVARTQSQRRSPQLGACERIHPHDLHLAIADQDVPFDNRRQRRLHHTRQQLPGAQINIQPLIDPLRPPDNLVRGRAIDRVHGQLERASGTGGGDINRDDGSDP